MLDCGVTAIGDKELIDILNELDLNGADYAGGTDKANGHNYTSTYARFLKEMRVDPINFVEIGVWHGGSMAMWSKYAQRFKCV